MPAKIAFIKFKECLNQWNKLSEKGEQYLSQQVVGQPSSDLEAIVVQLRKTLQTMSEEYKAVTKTLNLEENLKVDNQTQVPQELFWMKHCLDMYDQEFMVKECIFNLVRSEGFSSPQQLAGSIALWKAESYLDDEIQHKIQQLD
ncbi:hypothetical protein BY458DRAFT_466806 [Sporodiniella umbellata]|nr:hypothetical protein BY458DRAFT_466806 [Sporodiniella umbellata]